MKAAILIAALAASFGANATNCQGNCPGGDTTNNYNTTNEYKTYNQPQGGQGGAGGTSVGIGVGIGQGGDAKAYGGNANSNSNSGVYGSGNSTVKTDNTNLNAQGQQQGQNQTAQGGASSSTSAGGTASAAGGQGSGNSTSIAIAAPVIPKPAANSAYVGDLPQLPQGSCRLFIGGGATTRDGSATGMLPIGNDQTCLSTRSLEVMKQINASVGQVVFGKLDMLDVACKIEGMEKLEACRK